MIINKIYTLCKRDGVLFTLKRMYAWGIGNSPLALKCSFHYYKNLRLVFAPSMLTYVLFAHGKARADDTDVLERFLKPGGVMIDVGAHIGSMSLVGASIVGEDGKILSFEPVPKFFGILQKNIEVNSFTKIITAYSYAVGASKKSVYMNDDVSDDTTNHVAATGTPVTQITLDEFTTDISRVSLLKIDVEGYELEVLQGANETLKKTEVIYIEFYTKNFKQLGYNPAMIIELLQFHFHLYSCSDTLLTPFAFDPLSEYEINLIGIKNQII